MPMDAKTGHGHRTIDGVTAAYEQELDRLIEEADRARERELARAVAIMHDSDLARFRFERVAEVIHSGIIRPRAAALAVRFEHATANHFQTPDGLHSYCRFERTTRFPATVDLRCSIVLVGDEARLEWSVHVVPALSGLDASERVAVALEAVDWPAVTTWVENHLVAFLRGYLGIQGDPRYQQENVYIDPVCGMEVSGGTGVEFATYEGATYVFCAPSCRERFEANPRLFLEGIVKLRQDAGGS